MIAEDYRDDFRFKGITDAAGEFSSVVFDHPLDPDPDSSAPVRLLAITGDGKVMAASDGTTIKVGSSDQDTASWKSYTLPKVKKITQLAFTAAGDELYILHNEVLSKVKLSELASNPTAVKVANATEFYVAPNGDLGYLDSGSAYLKRGDDPSKEIAEDVFCICFDQQSDFCYISMEHPTTVVSTNGKKVSFDCDLVADKYPCALLALRPNVFFIAAQDEDASEIVQVVADSSKVETEVEFLGLYGPEKWVPSYFLQSLDKYNPKKRLTILSSTRATDMVVLESTDDSVAALQWPFPGEDSCRANFPTTEDFEETVVLGIAIDSSQSNRVVDDPWPGAEEEFKGAPIIHALLDDGRLISWWIVDKNAILKDGATLSNEQASLEPVESSTTLDKSQTTPKESTSDETSAKKPSDNPFANVSNPFGKSSGGTIGGTSSEAKNVFGSTGAFGSFGEKKQQSKEETTKSTEVSQSKSDDKAQDEKTAPSGGAFGSIGFGQKASSGSSGFGSSGFGGSGFGSSGFGASSSASTKSSSAFGSSGFGSSGFGQKPSTDAKSGFGNQTQSSFASHASTQSPFATAAKNNQASPFGAVSSENKPSPFGALGGGVKSSPFGESKQSTDSTSSPFGSTTQTEQKSSPFGSTQTESKPSPFGALKQDESKSSIFNSTGGSAQPSPFATAKSNDAKQTPFGSTESKTKPSPFGAFNKADNKSSLFGGSSSAASPFGEAPKSQSDNAHVAFGSKGEESKPTQSIFGQTPSSTSHTQKDSTNDSISEPDHEQQNTNTDSSSQFHQSGKPGLFAQFNRSGPETVSFDQLHISSAEPDSIEEPDTVPHTRGTTPKPSEDMDNYDESSFAEHAKFELTSSSEFESESEEESEQDVEEDLEQELEEESELGSESVVEEVDYREVFIAREAPPAPTFNYFDGYTEALSSGRQTEASAQVSQQYHDIVGSTKGHLKVLKDNAKKLAPLMAYHSPMAEFSPGEDDLNHPAAWAVGNAPQLTKIAHEKQESVGKILSDLQRSESTVNEILSNIEDTHLVRGQIDTMLKQLKHLLDQQEASKHRQLDFANEALRTKLQAKYQNVCHLESMVLEKLVPLKARASGNDAEVVKRLYDLVYSLRTQIKQRAESVLKLRQEVKEAQLNKLKGSTTDLVAVEAPPTVVGSSMNSRVNAAKLLKK